MTKDLENSVNCKGQVKIHDPYKNLAPFLDEDGVWKVGSRSRSMCPFTADQRALAILPIKGTGSKFTEDQMRCAHEQGHIGVQATISKLSQ